MIILKKLFEPKEDGRPMRLAIMMSGSGSNAKKIIERYMEQIEQGKVTFEPVLMFTDNPNSNAYKIATQDYKDRGIEIPVFVNPIRAHYARRGFAADLGNMEIRENYDRAQHFVFSDFGVDAVALAGYDWVTTPHICRNHLTVNVHPGNLNVKFPEGHKNAGKPRYAGLGWIPSAKAILNRESQVYTSVHLVTPKLDSGAMLALSAPQEVPLEARVSDGDTRKALQSELLRGMIKFVRDNQNMDPKEIARRFPIYGYSKDCQERLKVYGDWIEYPEAIVNISLGRYARDTRGDIYFDGIAIPEGRRRIA